MLGESFAQQWDNTGYKKTDTFFVVRTIFVVRFSTVFLTNLVV